MTYRITFIKRTARKKQTKPGKLSRNAIRKTGEVKQKGRGADALALGADERRDKLRKAAGRSKYPMSRGYLNGGTHMERLHVSMNEQWQ